MKKWVVKKPDKQISKKLEAECSVTPLCADVLAARGISSPAEAAEQFNTERLSDPFHLKDIREADQLNNTPDEKFTSICDIGD